MLILGTLIGRHIEITALVDLVISAKIQVYKDKRWSSQLSWVTYLCIKYPRSLQNTPFSNFSLYRQLPGAAKGPSTAVFSSSSCSTFFRTRAKKAANPSTWKELAIYSPYGHFIWRSSISDLDPFGSRHCKRTSVLWLCWTHPVEADKPENNAQLSSS